MPKAEDLTGEEIESIVSDVETAVLAGKIKRVSNEEVMRTRLAALENTIAQFNRDLDALYVSKNMKREVVC
ncbi:hypothetical protein AGMMS50212_07410 [Spirochaetia bacterium]|nr:hypothetical protein AGMMS50212_07410 [Spirochaetia bacterium]